MRRSCLLLLLFSALLTGVTPAGAVQSTTLTTEAFLLDATVTEGETLFGVRGSGTTNATLADADGAPVVGRTITFSHREWICVAATDSDGYAACGAARDGYTASFAGDELYGPSSVEGFAVDLHGDNGRVVFWGDETLLAGKLY